MTTEPATPPLPPEPLDSERLIRGKVVGPYELLLELASGGMATVFLARARDGRAVAPLVAIKKPHRHLASDKNFLAMLLDEARIASAIAHDNVVKVRELRFDDGEPAIVMDYVEGASLSDLRKALVAAHRAFDLKVALRIVLDALAGLHAAHELCDPTGRPLGLVHRDVSPHNVLVGTDGRSRLADFGVALAPDRFQETRTQEVKGKLAYLAPERVDKRRICTRQSDIFAMAIVLWECIAGRRLFRGDEAVDTLQEVMHLPIPKLRQVGCDLPRPLDEVIARGLSRDMDVRFATAEQFAAALVEAAGGDAGLGSPEQVASLVETIHGPRLAERHEKVRRALADDPAAEKLFDDAGLPRRLSEGGIPSAAALATLDAVAPLAPSERYAFGAGDRRLGPLVEKPTRWALVGVMAGLVVGVGGTAAVVMRTRPASVPPATPVGPPQASAVAGPSPPWSEVAMDRNRHVRVPLPFLATHVAVDGIPHDLSPAADQILVDIPLESGHRHHVVVTALEGSIAQGDVVERDGVATATEGFAPLQASSPNAPLPSVTPAPTARIGVVRNGFTKLK